MTLKDWLEREHYSPTTDKMIDVVIIGFLCLCAMAMMLAMFGKLGI